MSNELTDMENCLTGAELIAQERQHQLSRWSSEHDDNQSKGELALVGALYASPIRLFERQDHAEGAVSFVDPWPWFDTFEQTRYADDNSTYQLKAHDKRKVGSRVHRLVVAGALIAAEIDRLKRLAPHQEGKQ